MREEMKGVVGRDYVVIEQSQMNDALTQYGYPKDAILSPALATTLAKNIQARFLVNATLSKGEGNRYSVTARLSGVNDDAGNVVTLTQNAGESTEAFGKRLASALEPAVKTLDDAKACIEQRQSKPDKAADAANKAIKELPDHGLAHYCLALLTQDKKGPRDEVVKHLQAAAKGDPLSLPVWTALATQYQQANDTANTWWRSSRCSAWPQPTRSCGKSCSSTSSSRATRRRRSRWRTRASRSTPTTPTCTT
jgi:tetratricopeptide (TPR) repeat protein